MARDGKEQRIREVERCIEIWKENQWKHSADEAFFHYSQSMIDKLESKLNILTRAENWNEYI
nr:MAG TPA: hypothetical protein [Caudoviricetes sp.]